MSFRRLTILLALACAAFSVPEAKASIAPHRAVYAMKLASAKNGSSISNVAGKMTFEWADACDGWATQQHLKLHFTYAEGNEADLDSRVTSWESKDGKQYRFNVRRISNDKETESYRGTATLTEKGGSGKYTIPKDKAEIKLPPESLFPSAHTQLILDKAATGEKLFTRRVFDGSDEEGAADVSVFIGAKIDHPAETDLPAGVNANPLVTVPAWPARLAFYSPELETGEPDYEMNLILHTNGIARSMLIDYGDFAVSGTLDELQALSAPGC